MNAGVQIFLAGLYCSSGLLRDRVQFDTKPELPIGLGTCAVTSSTLACVDLSGKRDTKLTERIQALFQSLPSVELRFGKPTYYAVLKCQTDGSLRFTAKDAEIHSQISAWTAEGPIIALLLSQSKNQESVEVDFASLAPDWGNVEQIPLTGSSLHGSFSIDRVWSGKWDPRREYAGYSLENTTHKPVTFFSIQRHGSDSLAFEPVIRCETADGQPIDWVARNRLPIPFLKVDPRIIQGQKLTSNDPEPAKVILIVSDKNDEMLYESNIAQAAIKALKIYSPSFSKLANFPVGFQINGIKIEDNATQ